MTIATPPVGMGRGDARNIIGVITERDKRETNLASTGLE